MMEGKKVDLEKERPAIGGKKKEEFWEDGTERVLSRRAVREIDGSGYAAFA